MLDIKYKIVYARFTLFRVLTLAENMNRNRVKKNFVKYIK